MQNDNVMQTQFFEDSPPFKRALCQHTWCTHVDKCCNKIDKSFHSSAFPNIECCWLGCGWVIWPERTNVIGENQSKQCLFLILHIPNNIFIQFHSDCACHCYEHHNHYMEWYVCSTFLWLLYSPTGWGTQLHRKVSAIYKIHIWAELEMSPQEIACLGGWPLPGCEFWFSEQYQLQSHMSKGGTKAWSAAIIQEATSPYWSGLEGVLANMTIAVLLPNKLASLEATLVQNYDQVTY